MRSRAIGLFPIEHELLLGTSKGQNLVVKRIEADSQVYKLQYKHISGSNNFRKKKKVT